MKKKQDIINPYYARCNRKSLREFSFFKLHVKLPCSILLKIFDLFIISKLNGNQIYTTLSNTYKISVTKTTILKVLDNIRQIIANYMKDKYRNFPIGGDPDTHKVVALDETPTIHINGEQQWWVGAIETVSRKIRIDILPAGNAQNLEIFVKNHILPGTTFVTDGWTGYNFLDSDESVCPQEVYNHGAGNFGLWTHSTSNIEQT